jgi:photosystem II stability/assembly factor-like uncharacterized protein
MKWMLTAVLVIMTVCAQAGNNQWTTSGPFGGAIVGFTFHPAKPDLVFTGAQGGLFRSRNGGSTWERVSFESFGPPVIRIHPKNPNVMLVGGDGVYQSSDEGKTVQLLYRVFPEPIIDMEFDPMNPEIVYLISGHSGGVFKTTDMGKTWVPKNSGLKLVSNPPCCGQSQIEVNPKDGKIVFALLATSKIYKSTNGGDSWKPIQNGLPNSSSLHALAADPGDDRILYLGGEGIFKTTNAGTSWFSACDDCYARPGGIAIDPKNTRNIYSSMQRSTDGGQIWTNWVFPLPCIDFQGMAVHPKSTNILLAGESFSGGIFRSRDFGKSWQAVNQRVDAAQTLQLKAAVSKPGLLLANTGSYLQISRNFGLSWQFLRFPECILVVETQVHPANASLIMATGLSGGSGAKSFAISRDGGITWNVTTPFPAATALEADPVDEKVIYIAPLSSNNPNVHPALGVAKSTDQGKTWKLVNSGLSDRNVTVILVSPHDRNVLYVGTASGKIFRSNNGGSSWSNAGGGLSAGAISGIVLDPRSSMVLYATNVTDFRNSAVFKSTDGGRKWTRKTTGMRTADLDLRFIAVDPSNSGVLFAGGPTDSRCQCGAGGLFISTDGAESWSAFDSRGLGEFGVIDLVVSPWKRDSFFIGTERGVFSYTRAGSSVGGPVIEQLSPPAGKPGDTIAVNGRNFGPTQGDSKVFFGSTDAATAQSWTDTRIQIKVPNGVTTGSVTITVASRKSNSFEFIVTPSSGNVVPTSGPSSGGTRVTILGPSGISGTQFNVLFGSTVARDIRFTPPNIITCTTPPGSGTVDVSVTSSAVVAKVGTFTYQ